MFGFDKERSYIPCRPMSLGKFEKVDFILQKSVFSFCNVDAVRDFLLFYQLLSATQAIHLSIVLWTVFLCVFFFLKSRRKSSFTAEVLCVVQFISRGNCEMRKEVSIFSTSAILLWHFMQALCPDNTPSCAHNVTGSLCQPQAGSVKLLFVPVGVRRVCGAAMSLTAAAVGLLLLLLSPAGTVHLLYLYTCMASSCMPFMFLLSDCKCKEPPVNRWSRDCGCFTG